MQTANLDLLASMFTFRARKFTAPGWHSDREILYMFNLVGCRKVVGDTCITSWHTGIDQSVLACETYSAQQPLQKIVSVVMTYLGLGSSMF